MVGAPGFFAAKLGNDLMECKRRPEGSNWGDFGADDQKGRLNLLTQDKRREAAAEIRDGRAFCLSLPLELPGGNGLNPRRSGPTLAPTYEAGEVAVNRPLRRDNPHHTDVLCDDSVHLCSQYSTHWDSLAHIGALFDIDGDGDEKIVYYNGHRAGEHVIGPVDYQRTVPSVLGEHVGALALGVDNIATACVQGRGVMVNLARHFGTERRLIGFDDLMSALNADSVTVEAGDILCLYTGYADIILEMAGNPDVDVLGRSCAVLDGADRQLLRWITDSGIAALVADNYAVESTQGQDCDAPHAWLPLHEHCIFKLGLPLGELWYLKDLADWLQAHDRTRFFLTAPPLRLARAFGSPVTPIATV